MKEKIPVLNFAESLYNHILIQICIDFFLLTKEVWLNFEKQIKLQQKRSLISYGEIYSLAEKCGFYNEDEVVQAIRFFSDLGSLLYFETSGLKNNIVIDPQVSRRAGTLLYFV
jgi:hypothetical protein